MNSRVGKAQGFFWALERKLQQGRPRRSAVNTEPGKITASDKWCTRVNLSGPGENEPALFPQMYEVQTYEVASCWLGCVGCIVGCMVV